MSKGLISALRSFLKNGIYTDTDYTSEDFCNAFPFFKELITKNTFVSQYSSDYIGSNNNWFWEPSNVGSRTALFDDIGDIEEFKSGDAAYDWILNRYNTGDAYGIMKPIERKHRKAFNQKIFDNLCVWYQLDECNRCCYKDEEHYHKLSVCRNAGAKFREFTLWVWAEKILGIRLNLQEAIELDKLFFGDIEELRLIYNTEEYNNVTFDMAYALTTYKINKDDLAESYVAEAHQASAAKDRIAFHNAMVKLEGLFAPPDGATDHELLSYRESLTKYLALVGSYIED